MFSEKIFHEGELAVQKRAKETLSAKMNSLAISDKIPNGVKSFIEQRMMVIIGGKDADGYLWSSILFGHEGFISAKDAKTLVVNTDKLASPASERLCKTFEKDSDIGLLMIDFETRLRFRVNGRIQSDHDDLLTIKVNQAYPNCPKYIQRRKAINVDLESVIHVKPTNDGQTLNAEQQSLIAQSDTFFVASAHPERGVDVSHRGGQPGFVSVVNDSSLLVPDYMGNSLFNTLGNFQSYPYAGLVFIDFTKQRLLQLTGKVSLLWDIEDAEDKSGGTKRFWKFEISSWVESYIPFSIEWKFIDYSPFNPIATRQFNDYDFLLRVEKITQLTRKIKSFMLKNTRSEDLPVFLPGSHITLNTNLENRGNELRHYSLISDPNDTSSYEIAVLEQLQGRGGSIHLHRNIQVGDVLQVNAPQNDFQLVNNASHSILIAGGIGITPILSMLRYLSENNRSFEIHYSVQNNDDFALLETIEDLAKDRLYCYVSKDVDSNSLDLNKLIAKPEIGTHIYVCGPVRMIEAVKSISNENHWPSDQIHFESFGINMITDNKGFNVYLSRSKKNIYVPAEKTILDTLLGEGLDVPHQCKRGECSMCMTKILDGEVLHRDVCLTTEQRKKSMCICVSRTNKEYLTLDL